VQITRKLIISNTIVSAIAMVTTQLINLFVLPLFIKNLGAELYGIWIISNVVLGYLNVFDFGFTQGLQKYVTEARAQNNKTELSEVVISGFGFLILTGFVLGIIVLIFSEPIVNFFNIAAKNRNAAVQIIKISGLFCIFMWPLRISQVLLYASMNISTFAICEAVKQIVKSILMLLMIYCGMSVITIKWAVSTSLVLFSIPALIAAKQKLPEISWHPRYFRIWQLKRMSGFSLGMFYYSLIMMFSSQVDSLVIGKMVGMNAVAAYDISSKLFKIIQQVSQLTMTALMPSVFNLAFKDMKKVKTLLVESTRLRMIVATFFAFGGILISKPFIQLWVGEEYLWTVKWVRAFLFLSPFIPLSNITTILRGSGFVRLVNIFNTIKIFTNLTVSILLVPWLGIGGPIVGTIIAYLLFGEPLWFPFLNKKIGCSCKQVFTNTSKIIILFALVLFISYFVHNIMNDGLWNIILSGSVYTFLSGLGFVFLLLNGVERMHLLQFFQSGRSK
jgi:O-antigen/teichoic acid export membrane protein